MKTTQWIMFGLALMQLLGCGSAVSSRKKRQTVKEQRPANTPAAAVAAPPLPALLDESMPPDSTGATASVTLALSSSSAAVLTLSDDFDAQPPKTPAPAEQTLEGPMPDAMPIHPPADSEPTQSPPVSEPPVPDAPAATHVSVSETVSIHWAKASIAAVKLKPTKDPTTQDREIEAADHAEDVEASKELATASGEKSVDAEPGLALAKPDQGPKQKGGGAKPDDGEFNQSAVGNAEDEANTSQKTGKEMPEDHAANLEAKIAERQAKLETKKDELLQKMAARAAREKSRDPATRFSGPYIYDLLASGTDGEAPKFDAPDGSYRRIEFKMRPNFVVESSDPMFGEALVIRGTLKKGDDLVPFAIQVHHALNLRLAGDEAIKLDGGAGNALGIVFNLKAWFANLDLTTAAIDPETGAIFIDHRHNRDLWHKFRANVKGSTKAGTDHDGDGRLAATEIKASGDATIADVVD